MILKPDSFGINIKIEHLVKALDRKEFETAIELGCSEAYLLANVNSQKKIGYDIEPKKAFSDIIYRYTDFESDFDIEKADLIICSEVVEHIKNDEDFLRRVYDNLNKEGILFLTTINSNIKENKLFLDKKRGHYRRYSVDDITDKLQNVGFTTLEAYPIRSDHYYFAKEGIVKYFPEVDKTRGIVNASGLVYLGKKQ